MVGPSHSVDLKNYDALILVDVYRNVLGMSVVGRDFDKLKRFNLAEIWDPTPSPGGPVLKVKDGGSGNRGEKVAEAVEGAGDQDSGAGGEKQGEVRKANATMDGNGTSDGIATTEHDAVTNDHSGT